MLSLVISRGCGIARGLLRARVGGCSRVGTNSYRILVR